jgi:pectate lyase
MFATGGRGGTVVRVTNVKPDGPGSLAEAVSAPDRIVVFDVSGIIDLARDGKGGKIAVEHPNITIAGQTAPGEGICLRGGALQISASNVIVRHLCARRGSVSEGDMGDSLSVKPKPSGEKLSVTGRTAHSPLV